MRLELYRSYPYKEIIILKKNLNKDFYISLYINKKSQPNHKLNMTTRNITNFWVDPDASLALKSYVDDNYVSFYYGNTHYLEYTGGFTYITGGYVSAITGVFDNLSSGSGAFNSLSATGLSTNFF